MRRGLVFLGALCVVSWAVLAAHQSWAFPDFARGTGASCATCHTNVAGGADLTDVGKAYGEDPAKTTVPKDVAGAEYVSSKKCKMCHLKQHKAWQETAHVKALENLEKVSAEDAAEIAKKLKVEIKGSAAKTDGCLVCHVTGFKLAGGYPAADSTTNAMLAGVTCEACHGPGSKHVAAKTDARKTTISKAVSEKLCKQCHVPEMSPKFDYAEYSKKGVHQVPKSE